MRNYIIRRIFWLIVTAWLVCTFLFVLMYMIPGDIVKVMLSEETGYVDPVQYELLTHELGLDLPLWQQYTQWFGNLLRGDMGVSYWTGAPVVDEIAIRFPYTIGLMIIGLVFSIIIAIPVGVISALKQDTFWDYGLRAWAVSFLAAPSFWVGILLISFVVTTFRWFPPFDYVTLFTAPGIALQQYWMPGILMGVRGAASKARMLRSTMLEVIRSDYIRTARAKGLPERRIVFVHTLRNAMLPVITLFGLEAAYMLGGVVIMETLFGIPGLGSLLIDAVNARDIPLVMGIVLVKAFIMLGLNLMIDISYAWIDPRVRYN